jgi:hypothetical protein
VWRIRDAPYLKFRRDPDKDLRLNKVKFSLKTEKAASFDAAFHVPR